MKEFPQIFAFYSFKGGVGRSMAVLNLAYALAAKGRHVLVLDMDLEAPGLSGVLHREEEIPGFARLDMVDLVGWSIWASPPLDPLSFPLLSDFVVSIPPRSSNYSPAFSHLGRRHHPGGRGAGLLRPANDSGDGEFRSEDLVRTGSVLRAWLKGFGFRSRFQTTTDLSSNEGHPTITRWSIAGQASPRSGVCVSDPVRSTRRPLGAE